MNKAYRIDWTETERGWGTRPDGVTLHKDKAIAEAFIDAHWEKLRAAYGDVTPGEYSYPHDVVEVIVSDQHAALLERENTLWVSHGPHISNKELQ